jgi:hypothetical protein
MPTDLPRILKELHFTDSVKSLGRARPEPPPLPRAAKLATMRGPIESIDSSSSIDEEEIVTQAIDRHEMLAALFPVARRRENVAHVAPSLPDPHFRSAAPAPMSRVVKPTVRVPRRSSGGTVPLGMWLAAAMIAAIVSYNVAPQAVERVADTVRALDTR